MMLSVVLCPSLPWLLSYTLVRATLLFLSSDLIQSVTGTWDNLAGHIAAEMEFLGSLTHLSVLEDGHEPRAARIFLSLCERLEKGALGPAYALFAREQMIWKMT